MEPLQKEFEEFYKNSPAAFAQETGYKPSTEQIKRLMYGAFMGGYIAAMEMASGKLEKILDKHQ